jgi:hypothetical protein
MSPFLGGVSSIISPHQGVLAPYVGGYAFSGQKTEAEDENQGEGDSQVGLLAQ